MQIYNPPGVQSVIGAEATAHKGAAGGYASLDADILVPAGQVPVRRAGYNPTKLVETLIDPCCVPADWVLATSPAGRATLTADTTNYLCNDGTNFQSLKVTATGAMSWCTITRTLVAPMDISGKHIKMQFQIFPGTPGTASDYLHILNVTLHAVDVSGHTRRWYAIYNYTNSDENFPGRHTAYFTPSQPDYTHADFDPTQVAAFYMQIQPKDSVTAYSWQVNLNGLWLITPPATGHVLFLFEAAYQYVKRVCGYLQSLGLRGNIAVPVTDIGTAGFLTWDDLAALWTAGNFHYMYPNAGAGSETSWALTLDADKLPKIHLARGTLRQYGVVDELGEMCMAVPSSGWNAYDETLLGKELAFVPSNIGPQGSYRNRSQACTYGHVGFSLADVSAVDAAGIAAAAADHSLMIRNWHCNTTANANLCIDEIDACIAAGLKIITIRDLLTGNL